MQIRPFQAVFPNLEYIASADSFFNTVKQDYSTYRRNNFFQKAAQEALYVYQIQSPHRDYWGMIACADILDYLNGHILKHESTIAEKEQQQMQLLFNRQAMVKPVLLTYPDIPDINSLLQKSISETEIFFSVNFQFEQSTHRLWQITDGQVIQKLQNLFKTRVPVCYIADGHHRSSSSARIYKQRKNLTQNNPFSSLLCAFFPASQLAIYDYNRVVEGLNHISIAAFMARLSRVFELEVLAQPSKPRKKHELVMLLEEEWFRLVWKKSVLSQLEQEEDILDVSLLNEIVLKGILNIGDVRTDSRVKYVEGPRGMQQLKEKAIKNDKRVAFLLYPVCLNDLMRIASAGKVLPPKSTWFEPRVKNGLLVYEF